MLVLETKQKNKPSRVEWTTKEQTIAGSFISLVAVWTVDVTAEALLPKLDKPRVARVVGSKAQVILVKVGNLR
jgi:hypothetical protein